MRQQAIWKGVVTLQLVNLYSRLALGCSPVVLSYR